ncbi:Lipase 3 [Eumeta japonica]|uniref:Lipase n=1 Tax=Eumeta variegata TaxID=151549 RepID=A0A4C1Z7P9_EUMVA|nr:Lipase 3 [Eumeta japonica]
MKRQLLVLIASLTIFKATCVKKDLKPFSSSTLEDALLDFMGLAKKYEYNAEAHEVTTEDGYILTIFHLYKNVTKDLPVYLEHGIADSADTWIFPGPDKALGYLLADEGYDVWCGNARGNKYSRKHVKLNPDKDRTFWAYSFDELGRYDLPATIDYIIERTNSKEVRYVGHSEGTTAFYVMLSMKPSYNDKIRIGVSLSPVAFMSHAASPIFRAASLGEESINAALEALGQEEIFVMNNALATFTVYLCQIYALYPYCTFTTFLLSGFESKQLAPETVAIEAGHYPVGTSRQTLNHFLENGRTGRFQRYDFGKRENLKRYDSELPPNYNLTAISAPIALFCGKNDYLSSLIDVETLRRHLTSVVDFYVVPYDKWTHVDFVWGEDTRVLIAGTRIALAAKRGSDARLNSRQATRLPTLCLATDTRKQLQLADLH